MNKRLAVSTALLASIIVLSTYIFSVRSSNVLIMFVFIIGIFLLATFEVVKSHNAWVLLGLLTIGYSIYRTVFIGATIYTPGFVVVGLCIIVYAYFETKITGEKFGWL